MVVKVKVSTPSADIPFFVNSFHRNWAQRAGAKIAKSKFSYFRTFLPVLAIKTLQSLSSSKYFDDSKLEVCDRDLVVLLVDISGFTRLSDRFQGLGQAGIEALTTAINNVFSTILEHLERWGGDVVKFAGDAVIAVWETSGTPAALQRSVVHAVECARALECEHGVFQVAIPRTPAVSPAEAVERFFESLGPADVGGPRLNAYRTELETQDLRAALRRVPWLAESLGEQEIAALADSSCALQSFGRGQVLLMQGQPIDLIYVAVGDATLCEVRGDHHHAHGVGRSDETEASDDGDDPRFGTLGESALRGGRRVLATAGDVHGLAECLARQPAPFTLCAAGATELLVLAPHALRPLVKGSSRLLKAIQALARDRIPTTPAVAAGTVTLRLHQAVSCGRFWLAHAGGERPPSPCDGAPRCEFLIVGSALLRASEALGDAPIGSVVVAAGAWPHARQRYAAEPTAGGHYRLTGPAEPDAPPPPPLFGTMGFLTGPCDDDTCLLWPQLKQYCHEGARDLQDLAPFSAEIRTVTVLFVQLHLDLEDSGLDAVVAAHGALLAIQQAIYTRGGTLRQFLQDDKGLLAICVFGMPPLAAHSSDALRGTLAALDARDRLAALGILAGIGVTTGRAYSGFVGSDARREMCAMGSVVNMAARLMCKAGAGGILTDRPTHAVASLVVDFAPHAPVLVKGRDAPLEVFAPTRCLTPVELRARVHRLVRLEFGVRQLSAEVADLFEEAVELGEECSRAACRTLCRSLWDSGTLSRSADGTALLTSSRPASPQEGSFRSCSAGSGAGSFSRTRSLAEEAGPARQHLPSHTEMLLNIACFCCCGSLFSCALVSSHHP